MSDTPDQWLRAECLVNDSEFVSHILWELGALGVELQDDETFMDDGSIPPVPFGKTRLIAFFNADQPAEILHKSIVDAAKIPAEDLIVADFNDLSWQTAWQKFFKPVRLSRRAIVGPPWESFEAPTESADGTPIQDGVKIIINPGLAFGTGSHETTQLAASLLDDLIAQAEEAGTLYPSLLDVGCGSGILSILAYLLGIPNVRGIDVDEVAVKVANETLQTYNLTEILLTTLPLARINQSYPIVVANILGHIILANKEELARVTDPGGKIVISGVLDDQAHTFIEAFSHAGFTLETQTAKNEWAAFVFQRDIESE